MQKPTLFHQHAPLKAKRAKVSKPTLDDLQSVLWWSSPLTTTAAASYSVQLNPQESN